MTRPDPAVAASLKAQRPWWLKTLVGAAAVGVAWTGIVGMWLPDWVRPRVEAAATQALGTPVQISHIALHPWTLDLVLQGLSVGPQAAPMLKLKQAEVQISLESLWRLAPVIRRVQLSQPEVWLERQTDQRFNISPVIDKLTAPSPQPAKSSEPARFAVFNIQISDGVLRYTDRVLNQTHQLDQFSLGVPFVSNLPSFVDVEVQPRLQARVDGSPLLIEGKTLPFKQGLQSEVAVQWRDVDVAHWLTAAQPFLPPDVALQPQSGRLDAALTLHFEQRRPPAVPRLTIQGHIKLQQLGLRMPAVPGLGQLDAGWDTLQIDGLDAAPLERQAAVGRVALDGLHVLARPVATKATALSNKPTASASTPVAASPAAPAETPAWVWSVGQLHLAAKALDVQTAADAPWPRLDRVVLDVKGLSSQAKAAPAAWQLDVADQHGASVQASGQWHLAQQRGEALLALNKAQIAPWLAPLAGSLKLPLSVSQGEVQLQARLDGHLQAMPAAPSVDMAPGLHLSAGQLKLSHLVTQASAKGVRDQIKLAGLSLDNVDARLALGADQGGLRSLTLDAVTVDQLDAQMTRGAQGQWLGMAPQASGAASVTAGRKVPGAPSPQINVKLLRCQACRVQLTDQTVSPAAVLALQQTDLSVQGASSDLSQTVAVDLRTLAQGKGRVTLAGDIRPQPLSVKAKVGVSSLDMRVLQSYIDPYVNVRLADARAQADGRITVLDDPRRGLSARYQGRVGLSDLRVQDRVNEADFVSWKALSLDGADLGWAAGAVNADMGRITLKDFYGRVIINPNGRLNLAGIMRHEAGAEAKSLTTPEAAKPKVPASPTSPAVAQASAPASPAASSPPMNLRWQGIALTQGRVDFTDNYIKPNYSARLTRVDGTISAVSSSRPEPATVQVSGTVDDAAPLLITGQLHPLGPKLYTDIKASAKGIELTRLTPYASRYAGYAIDKGTLSVNVHYKVDAGKLEADNQIFLDQLTFGERTDSPDATKLPVQFAVSLLKNTRGEIDVSLPISGSLDDPEFSVGGIIWRVLVNLITKAVTAPFALLAGDGAQELGFVPFAPGSAELTPAAQQSLSKLATKLNDRPGLKLAATGRADPAVDVDGLQQAHLNTLMRQAKARATGQALADVTVSEPEQASWLAAAYKAADIKKPRNLIGLPQTLSSAEMATLLKASAVTDGEALRALANRRGDAVKAYLAGVMPVERVLLTASKVGKDGLPQDAGPSSRVQFDIQ